MLIPEALALGRGNDAPRLAVLGPASVTVYSHQDSLSRQRVFIKMLQAPLGGGGEPHSYHTDIELYASPREMFSQRNPDSCSSEWVSAAHNRARSLTSARPPPATRATPHSGRSPPAPCSALCWGPTHMKSESPFLLPGALPSNLGAKDTSKVTLTEFMRVFLVALLACLL